MKLRIVPRFIISPLKRKDDKLREELFLITPLYFKIVTLIIALVSTTLSFAGTNVFISIKDFGAKGDGKAVDSKAINDAIDAAVKTRGGTVYFPAGTYLSYSIHLKSNISLYLDQCCTLLAADSTAGGR